MAFRATSSESHHSLPACGVCGCDDVDVDYVEDTSHGRPYALELGECPRCDHRWTRPLRLQTRREAHTALAVRVLQQPADALPNAA